jgi:hypothetical protein
MIITPEYQRILKRRKQWAEARALNLWKEAMEAEFEPRQEYGHGWFGFAVVGAWIAFVAFVVWAVQ